MSSSEHAGKTELTREERGPLRRLRIPHEEIRIKPVSEEFPDIWSPAEQDSFRECETCMKKTMTVRETWTVN